MFIEPHGLLLVNKPSGLTSHDVVAQVRRILKTKEVGHSGTLDPLASGLMVLLIGEATKLSAYLTEGDKAYQVDVKLGVVTDTLDTTGQILEERPISISKSEAISKALLLTGEKSLPVPLYSAKKIDGKKLYEYARNNEEIKVPEKLMTFWNVLNCSDDNKLSFHLDCSKGSFIRSWVKLLGEELGCGATMSGLHRTKSHRFLVQDALTLDQLKDADQPWLFLKDMTEALNTIKKIKVTGHDEKLLLNGQISYSLKNHLIIQANPDVDVLFQIVNTQNKLIALVGLEPYKGFKIRRVFKA